MEATLTCAGHVGGVRFDPVVSLLTLTGGGGLHFGETSGRTFTAAFGLKSRSVKAWLAHCRDIKHNREVITLLMPSISAFVLLVQS